MSGNIGRAPGAESGPTAAALPAPRKIAQVCAVDFTLYHFLVPLVRGMADAGHEVVAACGDGPLAARVRAEGIRVEAVPFSRSLFGLRRHWRAFRWS